MIYRKGYTSLWFIYLYNFCNSVGEVLKNNNVRVCASVRRIFKRYSRLWVDLFYISCFHCPFSALSASALSSDFKVKDKFFFFPPLVSYFLPMQQLSIGPNQLETLLLVWVIIWPISWNGKNSLELFEKNDVELFDFTNFEVA